MTPEEAWPLSVRSFASRWGTWKQAHALIDFTDMIEIPLRDSVYAPGAPTVIFSDESQDLSRLESSLLLHWAVEQKIEAVTGYFGIGVTVNGKNADGFQPGNVFSFHAGAGMPMQNRKDFVLYAEIKGANHGHSSYKGTTAIDPYQELYLAPGVEYLLFAKYPVSAALLVGLTPKSSDLGVSLSTGF
jgi:hypothetical protein